MMTASAATELFDFAVNTEYTLRPSCFGSFGMTAAAWDTVFSSLGLPWYGVSNALNYVTHPDENSRSNPQPGVLFGVTGFPGGVYEFELAGGAGADADPGFGAPGGIGVGRIFLGPSDTLWFAVGQGGIYTGGPDRSEHSTWYYPNAGGWNGGGASGAQGDSSTYGGSGGGGTDIRLNGTTLADRIMVAGGGGGSTDQDYNTGGQGGGFNLNGQQGGYQPGESSDAAGQGGTLSAGGSGAKKSGTVYQTYMNGALWSGGKGYDESSPTVNSGNAAGGGGGGYYGGGGAVDETYPEAGGAGGGSGFASGIVDVISTSSGGANNGHPSWTWSASTVDFSGKTSFTDWDGTTFDPTLNEFTNAQYTTYQSDGRTINRRYGRNGWLKIKRIS